MCDVKAFKSVVSAIQAPKWGVVAAPVGSSWTRIDGGLPRRAMLTSGGALGCSSSSIAILSTLVRLIRDVQGLNVLVACIGMARQDQLNRIQGV